MCRKKVEKKIWKTKPPLAKVNDPVIEVREELMNEQSDEKDVHDAPAPVILVPELIEETVVEEIQSPITR